MELIYLTSKIFSFVLLIGDWGTFERYKTVPGNILLSLENIPVLSDILIFYKTNGQFYTRRKFCYFCIIALLGNCKERIINMKYFTEEYINDDMENEKLCYKRPSL